MIHCLCLYFSTTCCSFTRQTTEREQVSALLTHEPHCIGKKGLSGKHPTMTDAVVVAWYAMETAQRAERHVAPWPRCAVLNNHRFRLSGHVCSILPATLVRCSAIRPEGSPASGVLYRLHTRDSRRQAMHKVNCIRSTNDGRTTGYHLHQS